MWQPHQHTSGLGTIAEESRIGKASFGTYNLWGLGEPWQYTAGRGIVRGAVPGSPAATLQVPGGVWPRRRSLVARALRPLQLDLLGLQESREVPGAAGKTQAEELADDLGCRCALHPAGGLAVLSRLEILEEHAVPLVPDAQMIDGLPSALHVLAERQEARVHFLVCHLPPRAEEVQLAAVRSLLAYLDGLPPGRVAIVVGDLNATPETRTIELLTSHRSGRHPGGLNDAWRAANPGDPGLTMPSEGPVVRLDYVFVAGDVEVLGAERIGGQPDSDGFYPSDHLGVIAALLIGSDG